jgi:hypothetical protein
MFITLPDARPDYANLFELVADDGARGILVAATRDSLQLDDWGFAQQTSRVGARLVPSSTPVCLEWMVSPSESRVFVDGNELPELSHPRFGAVVWETLAFSFSPSQLPPAAVTAIIDRAAVDDARIRCTP